MSIEGLFTERERLLKKAKSTQNELERTKRKLDKIDVELAKHGY